MQSSTNKENISARIFLTDVAGVFNNDLTMRVGDIERALEQQIQEDELRLKANLAEQNKLRPHVIRYRDLERDEKMRKTRMRRIIATLGTDRFKTLSRDARQGKDISNEIGTVTCSDLPLWELMAVIVEQRPGIQVLELQLALEHFERKASRQAIESALDTHRDEFEERRRENRPHRAAIAA